MKVCILAAGTGSRNTYSDILPKGLLPIDNQPGITHLIDSLGEIEEIIIAIGSRGELYKEFIPLIYPELKITYVEIKNYEGPGAGPGQSLLECEEYLNEEFLLVPTDAYINEDISDTWDKNWMGVSNVSSTKLYCLIQSNKNGDITEIYDKDQNAPIECLENGFNGIAFIKDTDIFFKSLKNDKSLINGEMQVSNGFNELMNSKQSSGLKLKRIDSWHDFGSNEEYRNLLLNFENQNLIKNDEFTFVYKNKVFKYNIDTKIIKNKVERSKYFAGFSPKILQNTKHFFTYKYIRGELLSHTNDFNVFDKFFNFLESNLLNKIELNRSEQKLFEADCLNFYKEKTFDRLRLFSSKEELKIKEYKINGVDCEPVSDLLKRIDWGNLASGVPFLFHGDLQPENIIHKDGSFFLIDWRDSFSSSVKYGDIYYDLAKLNHALLVSGSIVRGNHYSFSMDKDAINIDFYIKSNLNNLKILFDKFIKQEGYDLFKIDLLTALIYINIAPLYNGEYSKFLFSLGTLQLQQLVGKE